MTDLIGSIEAADLHPVLNLNNRHAAELSVLTLQELEQLTGQAFAALQAGRGDAFLIALDHTATYASPNYLWFRQRYQRFVYVDRVVVDEAARGRGLARLLYGELLSRAKRAGHTLITCEVNSDPPNPASDAFHQALGFGVVGSAVLPGRGKSVRYFAREL